MKRIGTLVSVILVCGVAWGANATPQMAATKSATAAIAKKLVKHYPPQQWTEKEMPSVRAMLRKLEGKELRPVLGRAYVVPPDDRRKQASIFDSDPYFRRNLARSIAKNARGNANDNVAPFIYGGVAETGFAETVKIIGRNGGFCSAVRVSKRTVLTASHCWCRLGQGFVRAEFRYRDDSPNNVPVKNVAQFNSSHPPRCPWDSDASRRDVLLVLLGVPPERPRPVARIAGGGIDSMLHTSITVVGYGETKTRWNPPSRQRVSLVMSSPDCTGEDDDGRELSDVYGCHQGIEFVAGRAVEGQPKHDTCGGDSGGPGFGIVNEPGHNVVAGIVSRATIHHGECGSPGTVFVRLDEQVLEWVDNTQRQWLH